MHSVSCSLLWWNIWLTTKALLCSRQVPQHNSKAQCQLMLADKSCPEKSNIKPLQTQEISLIQVKEFIGHQEPWKPPLEKNRFNQEVRGKVFREQLIQNRIQRMKSRISITHHIFWVWFNEEANMKGTAQALLQANGFQGQKPSELVVGCIKETSQGQVSDGSWI